MRIRPSLAILLLASLGLAGCNPLDPEVKPALKIMDNASSGGASIAINDASDTLASGGNSGIIKIWSLPGGEAISQWKAHKGSVNGIHFLPEDDTLVSAGYDGEVVTWRKSGEPIRRWKSPTPINEFTLFPDRRTALTGHNDGWVRIWNLEDGTLKASKQMLSGLVTAIALSPDGREVAAADVWNRMSLWRPENDSLRTFEKSPTHARSLAFSPDGREIFGSGWFKLFRWPRESGKIEVLPTDHRGIVNSIQFMPDGNLASISRQTDSAVRILDPRSGKTLIAYQKHDMCGAKITVSPDGCFLATNSDDATVRFYAAGGANCPTAKGEPGLK
ncbi:MAG: hypothetical protein KJ558_09140 [Gammaproteobacteria bacterium]|nr:hypothetical protein [Gammaproteobacteria bacterium]MBU1654972.1 hypothetical protein [Gammaproteobacteria bacterium]MBU1960062.1 hypothetical protein [Gammaproteobacteria bacterium]